MGRWVVRYTMAMVVLTVSAHALAQPPPPQFGVVERYAAIVTQGGSLAATALRSVLAPDVVIAEYALHWSEERGTAAHAQVWDLISAGARLDVSFGWASADGNLVVTRERMWGEEVPEALSPLRSTVVYLVVADRILGITRVLDDDQRDALLREVVIGTWWAGGGAMRLDADGSYRLASSRSVLESDPIDSGTYVIEGGTWRVVSDHTTTLCQPGDEGVWHIRATTPDAFELVEIDEMCRTDAGRGRAPGTSLLVMRAAD